MNNIEDYMLVQGSDIYLGALVSKQIGKGWQPVGGPIVLEQRSGVTTLLGQAMVKYSAPAWTRPL